STPSAFADSTSVKPKRLLVATPPTAALFSRTIISSEPTRTTNQTTHSARPLDTLGAAPDCVIAGRSRTTAGRQSACGTSANLPDVLGTRDRLRWTRVDRFFCTPDGRGVEAARPCST